MEGEQKNFNKECSTSEKYAMKFSEIFFKEGEAHDVVDTHWGERKTEIIQYNVCGTIINLRSFLISGRRGRWFKFQKGVPVLDAAFEEACACFLLSQG